MNRTLFIIILLGALAWYWMSGDNIISVNQVAQPTPVCTSPGAEAWSKLTVAQRLSIGLECAGQP